MRRLGGVAAILCVVLAAAPIASAYTYKVYQGYYASQQPDDYTCVAASALTWVDYITGSTNVSTTRVRAYYSYGRQHTRYSYSANGLDPRAWAWILYHYTPAGYGFNDYRHTTQTSANRQLVFGLRATHKPVGALMEKGWHAFDVVGFYSSADPYDAETWTLYGFYVVDPWFDGGDWSKFGAQYNLSPNSYITVSHWNQYYFLKYVEPTRSTIWDDKYVTVLRASTDAAPSDNPPVPYGAGAAQSTMVEAETEVLPSLHEAIADVVGGLEWEETGTSLAAATVGDHVFVTSDVPGFPDYELVELRTTGSDAIGVAVVARGPGGFRVLSIQQTLPGYRLPDATAAKTVASRLGLGSTSLRLEWRRTSGSQSPVLPLWVAGEGSTAVRFDQRGERVP